MPKLETGKPAPAFTLPDLQNRPVALAGMRGRIVLINFWSLECPWAERADQAIERWMRAWGERVAWVSIASNANENPVEVMPVAELRRLPLVLLDARQTVADAYGAVTTPHIFIVDGEGILRYQGGIDDTNFRQRTPTRQYAFDAVEALLKGEAPAVVESSPYGCSIYRFST